MNVHSLLCLLTKFCRYILSNFVLSGKIFWIVICLYIFYKLNGANLCNFIFEFNLLFISIIKYGIFLGPCNKNDLIQTNPLRLQNATFRNCISIRISSTYIKNDTFAKLVFFLNLAFLVHSVICFSYYSKLEFQKIFSALYMCRINQLFNKLCFYLLFLNIFWSYILKNI